MSTEENIEKVRRGYAAAAAGDMAPLSDLFAADAVWHAAGSGVTSGDKTGRDAILTYLGELIALSGGSLTIDVVDIGGSEDYAYLLQHSHAEREGKVIDHHVMQVFRVSGGAVAETWEFFPDTAEVDAFWA